MTQTFEKDFPELKGKLAICSIREVTDDWHENSWVEFNVIKKHCLSRQRVKEVIEQFAKECDVDGRKILFNFTDSDLKDLKEKLELNKEERK